MSTNRVTAREFAAICFRILGVVILLGGVAQALFTLPGVAEGDWTMWGIARLVGLLGSLVLVGVMALPLIFHAERLVAWLFPESDKTLAIAVSSRELLACGLALTGVWFLATNLPYLVRVAGELAWYSEGSRRAQLGPEFLGGIAFEALGSVVAAGVGWALFRHAARITAWWSARGQSGT